MLEVTLTLDRKETVGASRKTSAFCPKLPKSYIRTTPKFRPTTNRFCFHKFLEMTIELRLMVWNCALDNIAPRVLSIDLKFSSIPALIKINRESREAALKRFSIFIPHCLMMNKQFFVNYDKDIIWINQKLEVNKRLRSRSPLHTAAASPLSLACLNKTQHLALNLEDTRKVKRTDRGGIRDLWTILKRCCPELKSLVLVMEFPEETANRKLTEVPRDVFRYFFSANSFE